MSAAPLLTVLKNGETIKSVSIEGEAILGRSQDCVIRLEDRAISRQHALFKNTPQGVQVEKRSEFAPLTVNGKDCTHALLKEGDIIAIGPYLLKLAPTVSDVATPVSAVDLKPQIKAMPNLGLVTTVSMSHPSQTIPPDPITAPTENPEQKVEEFVIEKSQAAITPPSDSSAQGLAAPQFEQNSESVGIAGIESAGDPSQPSPEVAANLEPESISAPSIEGIEPAAEDGVTKIAPSTKVLVRLVFKKGDANIEQYEMTKDQVVIGRGKSCDIIINDKKASRKNTLIRRAGLNFIIKDLDSSNGTYVSGKKIAEVDVSGEATIRIGDTEFKFFALSKEYQDKEKDFIQLPAPETAQESVDSLAQLPLPSSPDLASIDAAQMTPAPSSRPSFGVGGAGGSGMTNLGIRMPGGQNQGVPLQSSPNIVGIGGTGGEKKTLLAKFRELPPARQLIVGGSLIFLIFTLLTWEETPDVQPAKTTAKPTATSSATPAMEIASIDDLPPNKRDFVRTQLQKTRDAISTNDYDKALHEIEVVTREFPNFTVAQELFRMATSKKQRLQAELEEKKRREEEERRKREVVQLVDEIRTRMQSKDYELAEALFAKVLERDPENAEVSRWRKEIQDYQEGKQRKIQEEQIRSEILKKGWETYNAALATKKSGRYQSAIKEFETVLAMEITDDKLNSAARRMIVASKAAIKGKRDPLLAQAREAEEKGEIAAAFKFYEQAIQIDPQHMEAPRAIGRLREILHNKSKMLYTEGVLAEGYSDFKTAKARFDEILTVAPKDDIYYERAKRKASIYFKREESLQ